MAQRIVIAGMPRSGSHWCFNAVRLLCEARSPGDVWAGNYDRYAGAEPQAWHVVKIHRKRSTLAAGAQVVTSFRALPDVLDSHERMTGRRASLDEVSQWVLDLLWWQQRAAYWVWYPYILDYPGRELTAMAHALGLADVDLDAVLAQLEDLRPPPGAPDTTVRDPTTLLFQGHCREDGSCTSAC